jgi:SlyX protein
MDEQRLIEIETKLAYQEQMLGELNEVLTDQQGQLSRLARIAESLGEQLKSLTELQPARNVTDERPPHY